MQLRQLAALMTLMLALPNSPLVWSATPAGADNPPTQQQLNRLRQDIAAVERSIQAAKQDKSTLNKRLQLSELHIDKLGKLLRQTDADLGAQAQQLQTLRRKTQNLTKQIRQYSKQLALQLRSSHAMGQREYMKILFSAQNPAQISRMLTYFDYLNRQKLERIQRARQGVTELHQTQADIEQRQRSLKTARQRQQADLDRLAQARQKRRALLAELDRQIISKQQKLAFLQANQAKLTRLLEQFLHQEPIETETAPPPFAKLKGKLQPPTHGKVIRSFGRRQIGDLRSKGMLYATKEGQPVVAVAAGQVVYSDWLRGFGMLLIIDHGNQYMSLYGQNSSLYKETGDWVQSRELIASASGGDALQETGLYFELRYQGRPINPSKWLKRGVNR